MKHIKSCTGWLSELSVTSRSVEGVFSIESTLRTCKLWWTQHFRQRATRARRSRRSFRNYSRAESIVAFSCWKLVTEYGYISASDVYNIKRFFARCISSCSSKRAGNNTEIRLLETMMTSWQRMHARLVTTLASRNDLAEIITTLHPRNVAAFRVSFPEHIKQM